MSHGTSIAISWGMLTAMFQILAIAAQFQGCKLESGVVVGRPDVAVVECQTGDEEMGPEDASEWMLIGFLPAVEIDRNHDCE